MVVCSRRFHAPFISRCERCVRCRKRLFKNTVVLKVYVCNAPSRGLFPSRMPLTPGFPLVTLGYVCVARSAGLKHHQMPGARECHPRNTWHADPAGYGLRHPCCRFRSAAPRGACHYKSYVPSTCNFDPLFVRQAWLASTSTLKHGFRTPKERFARSVQPSAASRWQPPLPVVGMPDPRQYEAGRMLVCRNRTTQRSPAVATAATPEGLSRPPRPCRTACWACYTCRRLPWSRVRPPARRAACPG